jgi:hypothetical protein
MKIKTKFRAGKQVFTDDDPPPPPPPPPRGCG